MQYTVTHNYLNNYELKLRVALPLQKKKCDIEKTSRERNMTLRHQKK